MMEKERGKRRSKSQKVGELGESIFKTWAIKQRLSPTKPEYDYGIDFICTVFRSAGSKVEEASGAILAVQVRSTSAVKGEERVSIDRTDATHALRLDGPYALIGVDTKNQQVRFRFMDEQLIKELQLFLQSKRQTRSWLLDGLEVDGSLFQNQLREVCKPAYQHKLRWMRARHNISSVALGSRVRFNQNERGGIAIVELPFITDAFVVCPQEQETASRIVFGSKCGPEDFLKLFPPHKEILALSDLISGELCLAGALEHSTNISVNGHGIPNLSIPVTIRSVGDEIAYIFKTGLYLTISQRRKKDGQWIHNLHVDFASSNVADLENARDEFNFLKSCRAGAKLTFGTGHAHSVEDWGLELLSHDLEITEKVLVHLNIGLSGLHLSDIFSDQRIFFAIDLLNALIDGVSFEQIWPGFVLGISDTDEINTDAWRGCGFRVPIVMNIMSHGIVIWIEGKGSVYETGNTIRGFRPEKQIRWKYEIRDNPFPSVIAPELWFHRDWSPIPLSTPDGKLNFTERKEKQLEFGGEIFDASNYVSNLI